jgi:hypothetical protein
MSVCPKLWKQDLMCNHWQIKFRQLEKRCHKLLIPN